MASPSHASRRSDVVTRSTPVTGSELPQEFLIFRAGENASTKGSIVYDAASARSVLALYREHACDLMIDLEHGALTGVDQDARGWARDIEHRKDGSLWAVGVSWTVDGAARLRERRQRYLSPAFCVERDVESNAIRVRELINVAMTALPATHGATLLAASQRTPRSAARLTTVSHKADQVRATAARAGITTSALVNRVLGSVSDAELDDLAQLNDVELSHLPRDPEHRASFVASRLRRKAEAERRAQPIPEAERAQTRKVANIRTAIGCIEHDRRTITFRARLAMKNDTQRAALAKALGVATTSSPVEIEHALRAALA